MIWDKFLRSLEDSNDENDRKDYSESIRVRGIWNLRNLIDSFGFVWLKYLDNDSSQEDVSVKEQWRNANINTGILSALLLTVWFSFLQQAESWSLPSGSILAYLYLFAWSCSCAWTLVSTVTSVLVLIAMEETADEEEADYFLTLFDSVTFSIGSKMPIISLCIGGLCAFFGLIVWFKVFFNDIQTIIGIGCVSAIMFLCAQYYTSMVASLHSARQTSKFYQQYKVEVGLTVAQAKHILKAFIEEQGGVALLPDSKKFIQHICSIEIPGVKHVGDVLTHSSSLMVETLYNEYLRVSLFKHIDLDGFEIDR